MQLIPWLECFSPWSEGVPCATYSEAPRRGEGVRVNVAVVSKALQ